MAKLNKEQRKIVSSMICEKLANKLNKKHKKVLADAYRNVKNICSYGANIHTLNLGCTNGHHRPPSTKSVIAIKKAAFKQKAYITEISKNGTLNISFNKATKKLITQAETSINQIEEEIINLNKTLNTDFIFSCAFNDTDDVTKFVNEFVAKL